MNLNRIATPSIAIVNPQVRATIKRSTGYTTASDGSQVPKYEQMGGMRIDVQSFSTDDLRQVEGLNLQGNKCAAYVNGTWSGIVRASLTGGDLLTFNGAVWLVAAVLESWGIPGTSDSYTKLALVQQLDRPSGN